MRVLVRVCVPVHAVRGRGRVNMRVHVRVRGRVLVCWRVLVRGRVLW